MDILCKVCLEPWDSYCLKDGTFEAWQVPLFKLGAGCPACEGIPPTGLDTEQALEIAGRFEIVNPSDDTNEGIETIISLLEGTNKRPVWKRPTDPILWQCAGCKVQVKTDLESGEPYWSDDKTRYRYRSYNPDTEPDRALLTGSSNEVGVYLPFCSDCVQSCDGKCGTSIFTNSDVEREFCEDHYDRGATFPDPQDEYSGKRYCYSCFEKLEEQYRTEAYNEHYERLSNFWNYEYNSNLPLYKGVDDTSHTKPVCSKRLRFKSEYRELD